MYGHWADNKRAIKKGMAIFKSIFLLLVVDYFTGHNSLMYILIHGQSVQTHDQIFLITLRIIVGCSILQMIILYYGYNMSENCVRRKFIYCPNHPLNAHKYDMDSNRSSPSKNYPQNTF